MEKKYELTAETKLVGGHTLHRIRAVKSFAEVMSGEAGGWVENESNLSHEGECWIFGDAKVYGGAKVYENAKVCEYAIVCGDAKVYEDAIVYGNAIVYEHAIARGNATVCEHAIARGNAAVSGRAQVCGDAAVCGDATVSGNATVCENNDYIVIGPIGSRCDWLTFCKDKNFGVSAKVGCFLGSVSEFVMKVRETHGENEHARAYIAATELAEIVLGKKE